MSCSGSSGEAGSERPKQRWPLAGSRLHSSHVGATHAVEPHAIARLSRSGTQGIQLRPCASCSSCDCSG